ncbi:MAG: hypothetical protein GXP56_01135 [Deltaproteobacteria bacterium]|nr:hypothetical protein [Deltaproteobacteria bacterium]
MGHWLVFSMMFHKIFSVVVGICDPSDWWRRSSSVRRGCCVKKSEFSRSVFIGSPDEWMIFCVVGKKGAAEND